MRRVEEVIQNLNKLGKLVKRALQENLNLPFKESEWYLVGLNTPSIWLFERRSMKNQVFDEKDIKALNNKWLYSQPQTDTHASLHVWGTGLNCTIHLQDKDYFPLIGTGSIGVKYPEAFSKYLAEEFLKNNFELPYNEYLKSYQIYEGKVNPSKEERIKLQQLAQALQKWINGGNYEKAVRWGKTIEQLRDYFPNQQEQLFKLKYKPLFRGIKVKYEAFEKLLKRNKPLILKNRKYSSWTTSRDSAKFFTESKLEYGYEGVVLRRVFPLKNLLLDVTYAAKSLKVVREMPFEHEIIVKNANDDYKFILNDVAGYYNMETEKWEWKDEI